MSSETISAQVYFLFYTCYLELVYPRVHRLFRSAYACTFVMTHVAGAEKDAVQQPLFGFGRPTCPNAATILRMCLPTTSSRTTQASTPHEHVGRDS
jgi:hypothetical protein